MVVWIPMLDPDEIEATPRAAKIIGDTVPQFWDGEKLAGTAISRGLGEPDRAAWDIYLFYGPDAAWTDAGPPTPDAVLAQVGLEGGDEAVVASKGTLPPHGDQARLPARLTGRVDLVGENHELAALLAQVAARP